jgi:acetyl esterase/lipase
LVVWIHGGGWLHGSRDPCPVAPLATRGYVVAAVDYRLSGVAPFPAQLDDVRAAVNWLRQNANRCHVDPDHIGVWGASAGGTLACLLGLTEEPASEAAAAPAAQAPVVKCVVAFFPATDLARFFDDEPAASWEIRYAVRKLLGGAKPTDNPELARQASPICWIHPGAAPELLVHGGADTLIPPQQSIDFVEQLLKAQVEAHAYIVGGVGHGNRILAHADVREQVNLSC